ncbi:MAG TPA: methyltransferase domain-containing protein, partial [Candidatus Lustribacter sp.]|nr:methyltransferase domain-containing protein [Candidatus Lustribacter sp.]
DRVAERGKWDGHAAGAAAEVEDLQAAAQLGAAGCGDLADGGPDGGGTGGMAVPLAALGHTITVVDPSPDALAALQRRATEAGLADRVTAVQGDTDTLAELLDAESVDLVSCHGVLEIVDDPPTSMAALVRVLRSGGLLSLVVANRLGVVVAKALAGEFAQAKAALLSTDGRWGPADPLPRRFDVAGVESLLGDAGLVSHGCHGVRIVTDLVPSALLDSDTHRGELLDLESALASHPDYAFLSQIGTSLHVLAHRP